MLRLLLLLLLRDVALLVLRMGDVLRVLTWIGWWEAHRPDVRSHQEQSDVLQSKPVDAQSER